MNRENDEQITIKSRRIIRDERNRKAAAKRQRIHRDNQMSRSCHNSVTAKSQGYIRNQKSEIRSQISESEEFREEKKEKKIKICDEVKPVAPVKSARTWEAYSEAYRFRYGVEPVRNQSVNAQLCTVVKKLGIDAAPQVASYYLSHNGSWYVQNMHPVNLLVRDAEKLHTEWLTRRQITKSQAEQIDKTAGRVNVFQELIDERKESVHVKTT